MFARRKHIIKYIDKSGNKKIFSTRAKNADYALAKMIYKGILFQSIIQCS